MNNSKFDYERFLNNISDRVNSQSFEQNIDMSLTVCMMDFYNYQDYCNVNKESLVKFDVCINAFNAILLNRYNLNDLNCDDYINKCNEFLERLQEEGNDYFDECVNITCEIMHTLAYISTRDNRNIVAVLKLCFESADYLLQRSNDSEYERKMANVANSIERLDVSSLTEIHNSIR